MQAVAIVVGPPCLDDTTSRRQAAEGMLVEAFVAEAGRSGSRRSRSASACQARCSATRAPQSFCHSRMAWEVSLAPLSLMTIRGVPRWRSGHRHRGPPEHPMTRAAGRGGPRQDKDVSMTSARTFAGWSYRPPPPGSGVRRLIDRRQSRGSGAGSGSAAASSAPAFRWRICIRRGAESSPSLPVEASQRLVAYLEALAVRQILQSLASAGARSDPLTEVFHCSAIGAARISVRAQPAMHWRWRRERGAAA